jgi:putative hydrolase of the HAD superfamily
MNLPQLRLITLDLDDTVWPFAPVIQAAEFALLGWLGTQAPRLLEVHDQDSLREHRRRLMRERPEIAHDVTDLHQLADWLEAGASRVEIGNGDPDGV